MHFSALTGLHTKTLADNIYIEKDEETGKDCHQPSPGIMKNTIEPATMMNAMSLRSYLENAVRMRQLGRGGMVTDSHPDWRDV